MLEWLQGEFCELCVQAWRLLSSCVLAIIFWLFAMLTLRAVGSTVAFVLAGDDPEVVQEVIWVVHLILAVGEIVAVLVWLIYDVIRKLQSKVSPPC